MAPSKLKEVVIDIQGLVGAKNTFVPKEISILSVEGHYSGHWLIAPPCVYNELDFDARRQNLWLTSNFHRLEWECGHTPHKLVSHILREATKNVARIYVRGREKLMFLQKIVSRTIINLEHYTPAFKRLPKNGCYCTYHAETNLHGEYACAAHNAAKLKYWIKQHIYSGKVTLKDTDINKIWAVDAYRISQLTAHELSSDDESYGVSDSDSDSDTTLTEDTNGTPPPIPKRLPRTGRDVCGPGVEKHSSTIIS